MNNVSCFPFLWFSILSIFHIKTTKCQWLKCIFAINLAEIFSLLFAKTYFGIKDLIDFMLKVFLFDNEFFQLSCLFVYTKVVVKYLILLLFLFYKKIFVKKN